MVWETDPPVQRLARDGETLWSGMYRGGLRGWQLPAGQIASYDTETGLTGEHVMAVVVDSAGQKWIAALDGGLNRLDENGLAVMTPPGAAGRNPWDLYAHGNTIWLASLGGGVSRYANGSWTTYNTQNSNLPNDDIYAVAVDYLNTPWVGTIGYSVAALQGGQFDPN